MGLTGAGLGVGDFTERLGARLAPVLRGAYHRAMVSAPLIMRWAFLVRVVGVAVALGTVAAVWANTWPASA